MNSRSRPRFCPVLLALSLLATGSLASETHPVFLLKWGEFGTYTAQLSGPRGLALDSSGNVYVVDTSNQRIQKFTSEGTFLLMWGWGVQNGNSEFQICATRCQQGLSGSGVGQFHDPTGVAVDAANRIYVCDQQNQRIQRFDGVGENPIQWGSFGSGNGEFFGPTDVAVDAVGNVYVADTANHRIQKFDSTGNYLDQWGTVGSGDGEMKSPTGVAVDATGRVYVADSTNNRIQVFESDGSFLSKWGTKGTGNGEFDEPQGLAFDGAGSIYVTDVRNARVQKFAGNGTFLTQWGRYCDVFVSGADACDGQFVYPRFIASDSAGNLYISDTVNNRVQKFGEPELKTFIGEPELPGGR